MRRHRHARPLRTRRRHGRRAPRAHPPPRGATDGTGTGTGVRLLVGGRPRVGQQLSGSVDGIRHRRGVLPQPVLVRRARGHQDRAVGLHGVVLALERPGLVVEGGASALELRDVDGGVVGGAEPRCCRRRPVCQGRGVGVPHGCAEPLERGSLDRQVRRGLGQGGLGGAGRSGGGLHAVGVGVVGLRHGDRRVLHRAAHRARVAGHECGAELTRQAGDATGAQGPLRLEELLRTPTPARRRPVPQRRRRRRRRPGLEVGPELPHLFRLGPRGLGVGRRRRCGPGVLDQGGPSGGAGLERDVELADALGEAPGPCGGVRECASAPAIVSSTGTRCRTAPRQAATSARRATTSAVSGMPERRRRSDAAPAVSAARARAASSPSAEAVTRAARSARSRRSRAAATREPARRAPGAGRAARRVGRGR